MEASTSMYVAVCSTCLIYTIACYRTFVLAQKYIAKPLLIDGHKVGVRLWAVITSTTPLRSYLHRRGLVFFSSNKFSEGKADSSGHLTNAFRNMEGLPVGVVTDEGHFWAAVSVSVDTLSYGIT
mmetsp:Transcript_25130/g.70192  ORF Transcript_25130/g.70192 Transcript_25130/m.70192 type:complete len:124 (+) Transcript_25130:814-1185(+)